MGGLASGMWPHWHRRTWRPLQSAWSGSCCSLWSLPTGRIRPVSQHRRPGLCTGRAGRSAAGREPAVGPVPACLGRTFVNRAQRLSAQVEFAGGGG